MAVSHIEVLSVPVSDQDLAKKFYTETLGFTAEVDSEFAGGSSSAAPTSSRRRRSCASGA
jgi:catechol 2,3-dioxygenase-like lactoylglutathione lyase family enzyme